MVRLGTGDGTFPAKLDYATGANGGVLTLGDLNGDGRLDLVLSSSPSAVNVLLDLCP